MRSACSLPDPLRTARYGMKPPMMGFAMSPLSRSPHHPSMFVARILGPSKRLANVNSRFFFKWGMARKAEMLHERARNSRRTIAITIQPTFCIPYRDFATCIPTTIVITRPCPPIEKVQPQEKPRKAGMLLSIPCGYFFAMPRDSYSLPKTWSTPCLRSPVHFR